MKAEFELSIDNNGRPSIKFKHFDKDTSLDQKVLNEFIRGAMIKGITLVHTGSYGELGNPSAYNESYEIILCEETSK